MTTIIISGLPEWLKFKKKSIPVLVSKLKDSLGEETVIYRNNVASSLTSEGEKQGVCTQITVSVSGNSMPLTVEQVALINEAVRAFLAPYEKLLTMFVPL